MVEAKSVKAPRVKRGRAEIIVARIHRLPTVELIHLIEIMLSQPVIGPSIANAVLARVQQQRPPAPSSPLPPIEPPGRQLPFDGPLKNQK